jgi:hypothetical protein
VDPKASWAKADHLAHAHAEAVDMVASHHNFPTWQNFGITYRQKIPHLVGRLHFIIMGLHLLAQLYLALELVWLHISTRGYAYQ